MQKIQNLIGFFFKFAFSYFLSPNAVCAYIISTLPDKKKKKKKDPKKKKKKKKNTIKKKKKKKRPEKKKKERKKGTNTFSPFC